VLYFLDLAAPAAAAGVVVCVFTFFMLRRRGDLPAAMAQVGTTVSGVLYAALLVYVALLKRDGGASGGGWVILLLTVTWFGDTFAYAAGRLFGRNKLHPTISPGKTWEGAVAGLLGSFAAAALAHAWYLPELGWGDAVAVSLPAAVLGQIGDLCESLLKRA